MNFDLNKRTIFLVVGGSHAYGFATETSDWDYRGVCIPPLYNYIGILEKFEQIVDTDKGKHVHKHFPGQVQEDADMQIMELTKFVRLASMCNPNVIEILFTDPRHYIIKHPIMDRLIENRHLFLSKSAKARFCGYALSQLSRIRHKKRWLDNPVSKQPQRSEFGLPEHGLIDQIGAADALIQKEINEFMIAQDHLPEDTRIELRNGLGRMMRAVWMALHPDRSYPVGPGEKFESTEEALYWGTAKENELFSENFLEILNREKRYRAAMQEYKSYQHWLKHRNPARAEIEKKYKFDRKHATHLIRLLRMAREILETGEVHVFRPDADELLAIRNGAWSYEEIVEFAERENEALNEVMKKSDLPRAPDMNKINELVCEMIVEFNS